MGYGNWLHGEAVAAGTVMAAELSQKMGWLQQDDVEQIKRILALANLPIEPPADLSADEYHQYMSRDKKVQDGVMNLVLLKNMGEAVLSNDYDPKALDAVLERT